MTRSLRLTIEQDSDASVLACSIPTKLGGYGGGAFFIPLIKEPAVLGLISRR